MGLYPRKGAIAPGAMPTSRCSTRRDAHGAQRSRCTRPTTRRGKASEVSAWPSMTILRGKVMVADGRFHGDSADGQYLKRKIPPEILKRKSL